MEKKPEPENAGPVAAAATNALGTIDEVRALLDSAAHHELADRAAHVREKLDAAHEALEAAHREGGGALGKALLGVEENLREEIQEVEKRVRENPLGALLAAAGLGLLLGVFLARHRH